MTPPGGRAEAAAAPPRPPAEARLYAASLRLAIGTASTPDLSSERWAALLDLARRERCAALAWLRNERLIRTHAPPEVAERWRQLVIAASARGHAQLALAGEAATALERRGVRVVTLKGAPLAAALYGDPTVRACTDVDWFVERRDRARARAALVEAGWRCADAAPTWDETFGRESPHGAVYIEVHSSLLHPRFAYLPVPPPDSEPADVGGITLRRQSGALLPGYLAAHLAAHTFPPLLWDIDFLTLWDGLGDAGRAEARTAARRAGLARYLAWAERRGDAVRRASRDEPRALRALGIGAGRSERHPMWRHVWLAPTVKAAGRAVAGWAWPTWERAGGAGVVSGVLRRGARHWRHVLRPRWQEEARPARPATARHLSAKVARVDAAALLDVVREVVGVGGEVWVEITGRSMVPALEPGDRVLLTAPQQRPRRGDIVLLDMGGSPVLHRVVRLRGEQVTTRGDACVTADVPVPVGCVLARVRLHARAGA